jgi:2-polyprenyl-6-methoxyphenol hydroxylase-like FAD-dependent oxidoreductase
VKVIVIGAGIGGLCLAQGLRGAGVDVAVHERDVALGSRREGYRIHINPTGARALRACLPEPAWQEFLATSGPGGDFGFLTEQLAELVVIEESIMYPGGAADPGENHYAADRRRLRRTLGAGLDEVVRYGAEFTGYRVLDDGRVEAAFADGGSDVADLLVGADGTHSRVRRQLLPGSDPVDVGAIGVAHKVWLTDEVAADLPARLRTGMNVVNGEDPFFLFTSVFEPPAPSDRPYLLCALIARPDVLPPDVTELDSDALRVAVDVLLSGWHPQLRRALAGSDPAERMAMSFRASRPVPAWPTGPVTLLGDAIHTMPPIGGLGGNTALRDAHLLARQLASAQHGERSAAAAVGEYEADMREYADAAIRHALEQKDQAMATGLAATFGARAWFRLCAAVPGLRRRSFARSWQGQAEPRYWERAA